MPPNVRIPSVMPANAGIQWERGRLWVVAFAAMTEVMASERIAVFAAMTRGKRTGVDSLNERQGD